MSVHTVRVKRERESFIRKEAGTRDKEDQGLQIHCLSEFVTTLWVVLLAFCRSCNGWPTWAVSPAMCSTPTCSIHTSTINDMVLAKTKEGLMVRDLRQPKLTSATATA